MPTVPPGRITLIGGGLGGALLAAYLGQQGHEVDLYERRPAPQSGPASAGRSINLAISVRGLHALSEVGLTDEVLKLALPMRGRMIHGLRGELTFQPYDQDPTRCINSISRARLNELTLSAARALPNVRVHFEHRCVAVDLDTAAAELALPSGTTVRSTGEVLIGVDGAYSAVRQALQQRERFDFQQAYLAHGYKELSIPAADGGGFRLEPHALHIWPRRSFMMIALPNQDGSFTCTLFYPFDGPDGFGALNHDAAVQTFFERHFPDAVPLMPTLLDDFRRNPVGAMVTIRCAPWHYGGRVALVGDAAHAVVPFYGQGANAAFEDCAVLADCIRRAHGDWAAAFATYDQLRKRPVDALADLALANFIEMRDRTRARSFQLYKQLDRRLHRLLPQSYTPLYTMVSFTRIPYDEARQRARLQDRIILGAGWLAAALLLTGVLKLIGGQGWAATILLVLVLLLPLWLLARRWNRCYRDQLRAIGVRDA